MRQVRRVICGLVLLVGTMGCAQAACEDIKTRWIADSFNINASDLLTLSDVGLAAYVMGYTQGLFISVRAGSDMECVTVLTECTGNHTLAELVDRLRTYVANRPEALNERGSTVTFDAIFGACFGKPLGTPS